MLYIKSRGKMGNPNGKIYEPELDDPYDKWGGLGEEFKYHLVSWSKVCTPISEGRLGIKNLLMFNCALLGKCL
jgi:hypothetical protein